MDRGSLGFLLVGVTAGATVTWFLSGAHEEVAPQTPPPAVSHARAPEPATEGPRLVSARSQRRAEEAELAADSLRRLQEVLARAEQLLARLEAHDREAHEDLPQAGVPQDTSSLLALRDELRAEGKPSRSHSFCWSRPQVLRTYGRPDLIETPFHGAVAWVYFPAPGEQGVTFTFLYGLVDRVGVAWPRSPMEGR